MYKNLDLFLQQSCQLQSNSSSNYFGQLLIVVVYCRSLHFYVVYQFDQIYAKDDDEKNERWNRGESETFPLNKKAGDGWAEKSSQVKCG